MAVKTGAIFNSLIFGGINSADYGIYITGEAVYNAPERAVEMVSVPGRNGAIVIDQGHWNNIQVTYPAGTFGKTQEEFREAISAFRNAVLSQLGYQRLTDTYHPDEYRMAVYVSGLEVDPTQYGSAGEFKLKFDCKPQRWLTEGEQEITVGEWGETQTATGETVTIENPNGNLALKSLSVAIEPIQNLNGYDHPWVGGAGKNKLVLLADEIKAVNTAGTWSGNTYTVSGMTYTLNADSYGHIVSVTINGTTTTYPTFRIPINGLTVGQSYKLYRDGFRSRLIKDNEIVNDASSAYTFTAESGEYWVVLFTGASTVSNVTVHPMVCLDSDASTFEPYENICPISGRTEVVTLRTGKNLLNNTATSATINGVTFTVNSDGTVTTNGTATAEVNFNLVIGKSLASVGITSGTYTLNGCPSGGGSSTYRIQIRQNGSWSTDNGSGANFTYDASSPVNDLVRINIPRGATVNNLTFKPMIRLATDTDASYEPYQGTTYTTSLGRTVYGGTLDVVSGVLTVTHKIINCNGSEQWGMVSSGYFTIAKTNLDSELSTTEAYSDTMICNGLPWLTTQPNTTASFNAITHTVRVSMPSITSLSAFKTYLSNNNLQFVLKLATPQTYQLTPTQVELLTGTNNIWSDGDITAEYGQDPDVLYNPTPYDASPLLMVEGYGTIGFNGYEIEIEDTTLGDVVISGAEETSNRVLEQTWTFGAGAFNDGDIITIDGLKISSTVTPVSGYTIRDSATYTYAETSALTDANLNINYASTVATFTMTFPSQITFVAGTASTLDYITLAHVEVTNGSGGSGSTVRSTISIELGLDYIRLSLIAPFKTTEGLFSAANKISYNRISGYSTKNLAEDGLYIDCDLGDAYIIKDGSYTSLNSYIDLGSDLPVLASGNNPVTKDSTITELKIVPRYWIL